MNDPYDEEGWKWICDYAVKCRDAYMRECEKRSREIEDELYESFWHGGVDEDPAKPRE